MALGVFFLFYLSTIAPYFPMDEHPKIEISAENREKYMNGEEVLHQESMRIQRELAKRRFPMEWALFFSLLSLGGVWIYWKRDGWWPLCREYLFPKADPLKEIQHLLLNLEKEDALHAFLGLGSSMRLYLEIKCSLDLKSDSTIEILQEVNKKIDEADFSELRDLLLKIDYVKFAAEQPTDEEKKIALSQAEKITRLRV